MKLKELQESMTKQISERKVKRMTSFFENCDHLEKRAIHGILDNAFYNKSPPV